jgi:tetratricopeptide (TPR) repeat protein
MRARVNLGARLALVEPNLIGGVNMRQFPVLPLAVLSTVVCIAANCLGQSTAIVDNARQNAISLEQHGKIAEAQVAWSSYLHAHPSSAEAYAHLGFLEARQEHYSKAVPYYRKALSFNSEIPGLKLNLGLSLFKSGALKEAIDTFTPLLQQSGALPADAQRLSILIGMCHYGLGEYAEAVPYLKTAALADPTSLWLRLTLVQSCLGSKQFQCVLDVYHEILALNAESAEADMLAGEALDEMRDHAGAIQQFRAAAKVDPKLPNVHFALGYLLWTQKQMDEAAQEFRQELVNIPNHPQALTYLADVDLQLDDARSALPLLEKAIENNPKIELAHLDLGIIHVAAGHQSDALRELKIAEQLNPGDQAVHWRLARFYKAMGKTDEAKIEFEKTRDLQKAADQSVFKQLHPTQEQVNPSQKISDAMPQSVR